MIHHIIDLDEQILKHCDYDTLIEISQVNKHYNQLSIIVIVNDLLKAFKHDYNAKIIHNIVYG